MKQEEKPSSYTELANKFATEEESDIIIVNRQIQSPFAEDLRKLIDDRHNKHKKIHVILVTEGGLGDIAYRACRILQMSYRHLVVVVPGWCKSAGTLFCTGAHELIFGQHGELGPVDVQLRRADEIGERDSGLAIDAAFDGLSQASFKLFEKYMLGIKEKSFGSVTFKTAADIAAQVAVGLVQPIFAQLDPIKVGEIHRSVRVAEEYAKRLAAVGQNFRQDLGFDAVTMLINGYPSHGFVIDCLEAHILFKKVKIASGTLAELLGSIGDDALIPIESDGTLGATEHRLEYLNDETAESTDAAATPEAETGAGDGSGGGPRDEGEVPAPMMTGLETIYRTILRQSLDRVYIRGGASPHAKTEPVN